MAVMGVYLFPANLAVSEHRSLISLASLLPPLIPLLLGHLARRQIQRSGGLLVGGQLATCGLYFGYGVLVLMILLLPARSWSLKNERRSRAVNTLRGLQELDATKDQYAKELHITNHVAVSWETLHPFISLEGMLIYCEGRDGAGNMYIIGNLHERPGLNPLTKKALEDVTGGDTFWGPYS